MQLVVFQLPHDESSVGLPLTTKYPARFYHGRNEYAVPLAVLLEAPLPGQLRNIINIALGSALFYFIPLVKSARGMRLIGPGG